MQGEDVDDSEPNIKKDSSIEAALCFWFVVLDSRAIGLMVCRIAIDRVRRRV